MALGSKVLAFTGTITATSRAFSNVFASASECSLIASSATMSASGATGTRYYISSGATIQTYGAGATYLPGNVNGFAEAAQFAQYL